MSGSYRAMEETTPQPRQQAEPQPAEPQTTTPQPTPHIATGWRRAIYLVIAGVFFVLGVMGVFVPGLPATPFLLLTSYFLVRSSPHLNERLLNSRWVGPILVDWQQRGGVRSSVKWKAIILVLIALSATIYFASYSAIWIAVVAIAAAIGIVVIWRLPTI